MTKNRKTASRPGLPLVTTLWPPERLPPSANPKIKTEPKITLPVPGYCAGFSATAIRQGSDFVLNPRPGA
jgi:hypothetical protein